MAGQGRCAYGREAMRRPPAGNDYDGWVRELATSTRRQQAKRLLLAAGAPALPAIRRGLQHEQPMVRRVCVSLLDHLVDEASVPDLVAAIEDDDPEVVRRALHALACDQCKENACRPGEDLWVPRALQLLRNDVHPDIRAGAIDALGKVVRRRADVAAALAELSGRDADPGLRNMAARRVRRVASVAGG